MIFVISILTSLIVRENFCYTRVENSLDKYSQYEYSNMLGKTVALQETDNLSELSSIPGDVNRDKIVNMKDAVMILQYAACWEISIDEKAADVNADDKINSKDAALVLQYHAGWNVELFEPIKSDEDILCTSFSYGKSDNGRDLICYSIAHKKYSETILMNFAIHGYEDEYAADGQVLVDTANKLIQYYSENMIDSDCRLLIITCSNPDGLYDGYTNNGYGRCNARGIDLNRDFDANYKSNSSVRNYTEYAFSAIESQALRDLVLKEKPDIVLDFHGWLNETIGNTALAQVFLEEMGLQHLTDFTDSNCAGYFSNWANQQGALGLLVEFESSTSVFFNKLISSIDRLINRDFVILERDDKYKKYSNIESYTLSNEKVTTYQFVDVPFSSASYIDGKTDKCTIMNIYNNGWVQVKYPLYSGGYKTAYCLLSEFIDNQDYEIYSFVSEKKICVYRRNDATQELGTIFVGDECVVVDENDNMKQIIYPINGGYKMGWIKNSELITN